MPGGGNSASVEATNSTNRTDMSVTAVGIKAACVSDRSSEIVQALDGSSKPFFDIRWAMSVVCRRLWGVYCSMHTVQYSAL